MAAGTRTPNGLRMRAGSDGVRVEWKVRPVGATLRNGPVESYISNPLLDDAHEGRSLGIEIVHILEHNSGAILREPLEQALGILDW